METSIQQNTCPRRQAKPTGLANGGEITVNNDVEERRHSSLPVIQTVPNEGGDLDGEQKVGSILRNMLSCYRNCTEYVEYGTASLNI
jgi:hypothetical protein